jgi:hypothetical protein
MVPAFHSPVLLIRAAFIITFLLLDRYDQFVDKLRTSRTEVTIPIVASRDVIRSEACSEGLRAKRAIRKNSAGKAMRLEAPDVDANTI